jgi:atypical protein kinase C iota type
VKAASILKGFLNKNPADRLGCHKETGFMEIMTHPFFKSIEWEAVSISSFMVISGLKRTF